MYIKSKPGVVFLAVPILYGIYSIFSKQYSTAINSAISALCIAVFMFINRKFLLFTKGTYYAITTFILLSAFAGRTLDFYSSIPFWDKLLHFLSGFVAVTAGRQLYTRLNGNAKNIFLINFFTFCFALSTACLWEIFEFFSDILFGTFAQNASLSDTMWDMIACTASTIVAVFLPLLFSKKHKS